MKCFESIDSVWLGYSSDPSIRKNGASGGCITGTLAFLLEKQLIDGAVVTVPDPDKYGRGISTFATTREEVLRSAKSIYNVTSLSKGLSEASGRVAVVGLPCQITSYQGEGIKLGIFCGKNILPSALDEVVIRHGFKLEEVKSVCYRAFGWYPYGYTITLKSGVMYKFPWQASPLQEAWESEKHRPPMCKTCTDFLADDADISFGDAWLRELYGNEEGFNLIVVQKSGKELMEKLIKNKVLTVTKVDTSYLLRSNGRQLEAKRRNSGT